MDDHQFTEQRACRLVWISRSSLTYQAWPDRHARLTERLINLSGKDRRYGYRMLHAKLVREGFSVNVKVVARIYHEEGLWLRRTKRSRARAVRGAWCPVAPSQRWSLDFTSEALANGRNCRTANLKDDCTRYPRPGDDNRLRYLAAAQAVIVFQSASFRMCYGPKLRGRALDGWSDDHGDQLYFIDPGKPIQTPISKASTGDTARNA